MWMSAIASVVKGFFASIWDAWRRFRQDGELVDNARNEVTAETAKKVLDANKENRKIRSEHKPGKHDFDGVSRDSKR